MLLSAPKSKLMVTGGEAGTDEEDPIVTINGTALGVVKELKYLGTIISAGGKDKEDLRQRIGRVWGAQRTEPLPIVHTDTHAISRHEHEKRVNEQHVALGRRQQPGLSTKAFAGFGLSTIQCDLICPLGWRPNK